MSRERELQPRDHRRQRREPLAGDDLLLRREHEQRHAEEDDAGPARPLRLRRPDGRRSRRAHHDGGHGADGARNVLPHRQRAPGAPAAGRSSGRSRRSRSRAGPRQNRRPTSRRTALSPICTRPQPDQHRTFEWSIVDAADGSGLLPDQRLSLPRFPDRPHPGRAGRGVAAGQYLRRSTTSSTSTRPTSPSSASARTRSRRGQASSPYRYTSLRDTVDIPPGHERDHPFPRQPRAREVRLPLPHPSARRRRHDDGRPRRPERLPTADRPRFDSAGQPTHVVVKDGNGKTAGRVLRPGGVRRGVATATGELTDDLDGRRRQRPVHVRARAVRSPSTTVSPSNGSRTSGRSAPNASASALRSGTSTTREWPRSSRGASARDRASCGSSSRTGRSCGRSRGRFPGGCRRASRSRPRTSTATTTTTSRSVRAETTQPDVVGVSGLSLSAASSRGADDLQLHRRSGDSGVNLAAGYYDPTTRPGLVANLVTTPRAAGPRVGRRSGSRIRWIT